MMTALIAFFALSACASVFIVATVALNARSGLVEASAAEFDVQSSPVRSGSVVPAFSH